MSMLFENVNQLSYPIGSNMIIILFDSSQLKGVPIDKRPMINGGSSFELFFEYLKEKERIG